MSKDSGPKQPFEFESQIHSRMQQEIRHGLRRIVPAEVLEVQKDDAAVATTQRVVKAEIGGTERSIRRVEFLLPIKRGG